MCEIWLRKAKMALDWIAVCFLQGKVNNLEYINNNGEN